MKCVGIQQLDAVRRLQARGYSQLKRTVYLSFVPDEELGGALGMRPFVTGKLPDGVGNPPEGIPNFAQLNIGFCLDEGLASPTDHYLAYYDERRPCWFSAHFHGQTGHALQLPDNTAGVKLSAFLSRYAISVFMFFCEQQRSLIATVTRTVKFI